MTSINLNLIVHAQVKESLAAGVPHYEVVEKYGKACSTPGK